jgi:hypothetical protein
MKFFRYLGVQVFAYGLDMGGFLAALHWLHAGPLQSNLVGKLIALPLNWLPASAQAIKLRAISSCYLSIFQFHLLC